MPNLSNSDLSNFQLNLPSVKKQQEIIEVIDKLASETERLGIVYKSKLEALDELKKSLLQKAFTGQLTKDFREGAAA